ncbi:MAG: PorV/PorQ family protein [Elusimicrobia bacterium]|nr:PorV/PorQ family protein [Candidatus Obscuribacterium magneticum]
MKKLIFNAYLLVVLISLIAPKLHAAGTTGGLTLAASPDAVSASMAEAFTAASNNIAAFHYNPASLKSMKTGQAALLYQKGLSGEDSYGHFSIGGPFRNGSLGFSLGYYNAGTIDLFDGVERRSVNAQTDTAISLGYARDFGRVSWGLTGKYLSSQLIGSEKAVAYAGDLGMSLPLIPRVRFGAAIQNVGTQLKYINEGDPLPVMFRTGVSLLVAKGRTPTTILLDAPYYMNDKEVEPAAGLEVLVGPMAIRGGYKMAGDSREFSMGIGFAFGPSTLDYSFGLMQEMDAQHRVSLSMRFGGVAPDTTFARKRVVKEEKVAKKEPKPLPSVTLSESRPTIRPVYVKPAPVASDFKSPSTPRRIYVVKPGDTLGKIAQRYYGTSNQWRMIYTANRHLLDSPTDIKTGQKIILP